MKLQRFLSLKQFNLKTLWFPIIKSWIQEEFNKGEVIEVAIDRSQVASLQFKIINLTIRAWQSRATAPLIEDH